MMMTILHTELNICEESAEVSWQRPIQMVDDGVDKTIGRIWILLADKIKAAVPARQGRASEQGHSQIEPLFGAQGSESLPTILVPTSVYVIWL